MGDRGQASEWETTLADLHERRTTARAMGGEERLTQAPRRRQARRARPHRPSPGPRVVPGAGHARRWARTFLPTRRDGIGPHRRPAGAGRRRGLHREGRHHQPSGELEALPDRRARGARSGAARDDARGRRLPGRRARPRAHADRPARAGPLLGTGPARHRGARGVGRPRRAGRTDVRLRGDEPTTPRSSPRPAGRVRVDGRDGHQGGPRRTVGGGRRAG